MATNYREPLENPQKGNAKYITTRTIEVEAMDTRTHHTIDRLIENLCTLELTNYTEGIQTTGERGVHRITFYSEERIEKWGTQNIWTTRSEPQ